jgi:hypothetical protein
MVGFRNVFVRGYDDIDLAIVRDIVERRLDDLIRCVGLVRSRLSATASNPRSDPIRTSASSAQQRALANQSTSHRAHLAGRTRAAGLLGTKAQVALEGVIGNTELPAGFPLVIAALFEDQAGVALPHARMVDRVWSAGTERLRVAPEERRGQIVELQRRPAGQRDRAFDDALELPDVAGPVVGEQRVGRGH